MGEKVLKSVRVYSNSFTGSWVPTYFRYRCCFVRNIWQYLNYTFLKRLIPFCIDELFDSLRQKVGRQFANDILFTVKLQPEAREHPP